MEIGIQQLQIGRLLKNEKVASNVLRTLRNIGFDSIELNGFMIRKNPLIVKILTSLSGMGVRNSDRLDWKKLIQESKLHVLAIHEDLMTLETKLQNVVEECMTFHTDTVVLTGNYRFPYADRRELHLYCERLNDIGRKLSEQGVSFLYHNHNAETQRLDSKRLVFDEIVSLLDRRYVNFELDTYWFAVSGIDCMKVMRELQDRIRLHHICDNGKRKKGIDITPIVKTGEIECGMGCMNLKEMIELDKQNKTKAVILEQHKNFMEKNVLNSAAMSFAFLSGCVR